MGAEPTRSRLDADDARVIGDRRSARRVGLTWLFPVFYVLFAVFHFVRGSVGLGVFAVAVAAAYVFLRLRPPTVVDERGIHRPYRWRRRFIAWPEVDAVVIPPTGLEPPTAPRVALVGGGRPVVLDDIPPDQAETVARIGDRPLHRPPVTGVPTVPLTPRRKEPTDLDIEADVSRRAAALHQRWSEIEAENRHRPRSVGRTDSSGRTGSTAERSAELR